MRETPDAAAAKAERRVMLLLGLARRAGLAVAGTRSVRDAARRGELRAVLVAADAAENAWGRLGAVLDSPDLSVLTLGTRETLGMAVGRRRAVVVGVRDAGLAQRIVSASQRPRRSSEDRSDAGAVRRMEDG